MSEGTGKQRKTAAKVALKKAEAKGSEASVGGVNEDKTRTEVDLADMEGDIVDEFTQQLSIFNQFIYNARNEDVTLIVENLGFGDVYVSDKANVRIGDESQRILFKEQRAIKASKLFFTSASQPVVSILEIK
jgi:hypothetical protein